MVIDEGRGKGSRSSILPVTQSPAGTGDLSDRTLIAGAQSDRPDKNASCFVIQAHGDLLIEPAVRLIARGIVVSDRRWSWGVSVSTNTDFGRELKPSLRTVASEGNAPRKFSKPK